MYGHRLGNHFVARSGDAGADAIATFAANANRPNAEVVVLGHVGVEGVAELSGLRRLPLSEPVVIEWWHHRRVEIPDGDAGRVAWLDERWRTLDAWVGSIVEGRQPLRDPGRGAIADTQMGRAMGRNDT